jgi:hypothetical protein
MDCPSLSFKCPDLLIALVEELAGCPTLLQGYFNHAVRCLGSESAFKRFLLSISSVQDLAEHVRKAATYDTIASLLPDGSCVLDGALFLGCLQLLRLAFGTEPLYHVVALLGRLLLPLDSLEAISSPASDAILLELLQALSVAPVHQEHKQSLVNWLLVVQKKGAGVEAAASSSLTTLQLSFYTYVSSCDRNRFLTLISTTAL